ncbi:MAG TPA: hypothetical protein VGO67_00115 [Verrucomicrobiae bacterium]|jgi:hypothetical protein
MSADSSVEIHGRRIPLFAKVGGTVFLVILIPIYLRTYGPTNFLWFCDTALILTVVGMWMESQLLISMCSVGILVPQALWLIDFGIHFFGIHILGLANYMFDSKISIFTRGLSLFHGWLPFLLVWLLRRLGYDSRAFFAWGSLATCLILICYLFTPPAGAALADPNIPVNINNIYGFNDQRPQQWINQNAYVALWTSALWLLIFLPTHLILRKYLPPARMVRVVALAGESVKF